jgi:AAA domain/Bifunctional DNA primase/polymerase, N-terminal
MGTAEELRRKLRAGGYHPLPIWSKGKAPPMDNWSEKIAVTNDEIVLWNKLYPYAQSTGFLTRNVPVLDADVLNPEAAEAVEALVRERFEEHGNILVRIGLAPKRAIPFRTDTPFKKVAVTLIAPDGSTDQKIELLADGQQLVAFGIHKDTGKPYRWHGGSPDTTPRNDLPYIHEEEGRDLVAALADLLVHEHGYQRAPERPKKARKGNGNGLHGFHDMTAFAGGSADWGFLQENIRAGRELHDSLRDLAGKLVTSGMGVGAAINCLQGMMEHSEARQHDPRRWQERLIDIPRLVESAGVKEQQPTTPSPPLLRPYVARPFSEIPRRQWLHAGHYIRRQVVMTVAPGGFGKTSIIICNVIEMSVARGLIGPAPLEPLRVAYWNAEDDDDEVERRIAAVCIRHDIDPKCLEQQLFLGSRITGNRRIAMLDKRGNVSFDQKLLAEVTQFMGDNHIDCAIFDPLIAFHKVPEGDNTSMEQVIKEGFEPIAIKTNSCVELSQHTRKSTQASHGELTADDSRGAGAIVNAARSVRILNRMTKEEAEMPQIEPEERRHFLRVARDKTNLAPPGKATWVHLISIDLPNKEGMLPGDKVQAAEPWTYPQPFDGVTPNDMRWAREEVRHTHYRTAPNSPAWFGYAVAKRLGMDIGDHGNSADWSLSEKGNRKRVASILRTWIDRGVLSKEKREDEAQRKEFEFFIPGNWDEGEVE